MHEEALFKALSTENTIPWEKSAEHFMHMKLASGGLLGDEIDLLVKTAEGSISPEEIQRAMDQGTLSGVRSSVAQDITNHAKHQRTHGERLGKGVGSLVGIGGGLLAGRGKGHSIGEKAFRAAVGMVAGHEGGKVIGQELDAHKLNKRGSMSKESAISPRTLKEMVAMGAPAVLGAGIGASTDPEHRLRNGALGALAGAASGAGIANAGELARDAHSPVTKGLILAGGVLPSVFAGTQMERARNNAQKVAGVLGQIGGWALKHPHMAAGAAGAGLGALTGAASTVGNPNASMLGGAAKGALVGGGLGLAAGHLASKASGTVHLPSAKGQTMNTLKMTAGQPMQLSSLQRMAPIGPAGSRVGLSPKMAAAILKEAMIKEGWSLRNLFKAVPEVVPPEDLGEAAVSGGLQEGPAGAINEAAGQAGALAGHAIGEKYHVPMLGAMAGNMGAKGLAGQITEGMEVPKTAAATKLLSAIRSFKKTAEEGRNGLSTTDEQAPVGPNEASGNQFPPGHDELGAAPDAEPVATIDPDLQPDPADAIMALLQKGNESEFHAARADEAQQAASAAEEKASLLEGQMQQLLQEIDQVKQEQGGQAQQASEQAMMASQDAMSARTESQAAQQQVMQLRQSITSYRQQLMDMLSQDPTAAVGPPPVPVAPPPGAPGMEGAQGGPGPEGQQMPPGGGAQPQEMPAEATGGEQPSQAAPEAPKAPATPKAPSDGSGVSVNIHPPKAAKPAAKA